MPSFFSSVSKMKPKAEYARVLLLPFYILHKKSIFKICVFFESVSELYSDKPVVLATIYKTNKQP